MRKRLKSENFKTTTRGPEPMEANLAIFAPKVPIKTINQNP